MHAEYPITHYAPGFNYSDETIKVDVYKRVGNPYTKSRVLFGNLQNGLDVAIKFSGYKYGTKREWDGLRLVNSVGIPAPILLCAVRENTNGSHGIISTKIQGDDLYKKKSNSYRYNLGQIISDIHANVPITGNEWQDSGKQNFTYFENQINSFSKSTISEINSTSKPHAMLQSLSKNVDNDFSGTVPVFTHNDIHNEQAIVNQAGKVSVIDFEEWKEEHPIKDLSIYLLHTLRNHQPLSDFKNFSLGFNHDRKLESDDLNFLAFYLLFAAIRSVDYHSKILPSYVKTALTTLDIITKTIDAETFYK
jgi:aminoglycoside phosphotransferase (APT) family kinase protein